MGKETNVLKSLEESSVSRRSFLKGTAALGAMAAMYGCSKDGGSEIIYGGGNNNNTPIVDETLEETVFMGCSPHNCGGGACGIAAHVAGGRVVRFTTDDRPSYDMIDNKGVYDSQRRGCVRCRSKKQWLYRPDRLLYPLKQTKERGDLSGFVKISWAQAAREIAEEMIRIKNAYGPESFHRFYSTGDGAAYPRSRQFSANLLFGLGGEYAYHDDYSFPSWYTAGYFTWGNTYPGANSAPDLQNSKVIVLWSGNPSEMIGSCNVSWYLTQARDMGVPVICVDQRISKTASMLATGAGNVPAVITPVGGTDGALIAAMLYHLVKQHLDTVGDGDIWQTTKYLNPRMVAKYVHGFFDNIPASGEGSTYSYKAANSETNYPVADGGSYSAYIFGSEKIAFNNKASIYPDDIGYNTSADAFDWYKGVDADGNILKENRVDELHGKKTKCYGQTPKNPAWAEKITGVPAATIEAFAEYLAEVSYNNEWGGISLLQIGGFQRNTEGEQGIRAFFVLAGVLGCFGKNGAAFGNPSASAAKDASVLPSFTPHTTPWADGSLKANIKSGTGLQSIAAGIPNIQKRFDDTKLTDAVSNKEGTNSSFPVFMWQDAIEKGSTGKSRWGAPDVANGPAIKLIFNFGGNCVVNQAGDYNLTTQILKMPNAQTVSEDANFPNRKYQLELLVTSDFFMTSSAQYSDYVLPASMAFERNFYKTVDDAVHFSPKAVDGPGEVLSDYEMTWRIHDYLGSNFTGGLTNATTEVRDERLLLKSIYHAPTAGEYAGMTFEEFVAKGLVTSGTQVSNPISITWETFRTNPDANPLKTPTGKIEAYSQGMCEYYEARGFNNDDTTVQLVGGGSIKTKGFPHTNGMYVYPVPMYIPLVEGVHASKEEGYAHPDPLDTEAKGYTYRLHNWHMQYRSHSTLNSNAYLNELYKKDINGNPAFYSLDRGQNKVYGADAAICDENVYEPVFVSPNTASALGIPEKGARVVIYNDRGAIYAYAQISKLIHDNEIMIGQGAWASVIDETFTIPGRNITHKIDTGGCSNTLMSIRPSRICQGMTLSNDTKVGIKVI